MRLEQIVGRWRQQGEQRRRLGFRIKPGRELIRIGQQHRHAVVDRRHHGIRFRGRDSEAEQRIGPRVIVGRFVCRPRPALPQPGECHHPIVARLDVPRLLGSLFAAEFEEAVERHQAAAPLRERHAECAFLGDGLRLSIGVGSGLRIGAQKGPLFRAVPVVHKKGPRVTRSAVTSDGAARVGGLCGPTGATRGGPEFRLGF